MNNNVVDTEYFLLFKEKDNDLIQKRIRVKLMPLLVQGFRLTKLLTMI